jgi:nitrogen fixation/metabolism regulation signal transduction histidine kinase
VAATFLLPRYVGYPGITTATSLSQLFFGIGLVVLCLRRARIPHAAQFIWTICKLLIAGGIAILLGYLVSDAVAAAVHGNTVGHAMSRLAISGLTILTAFLGAALILGFGSYFALLCRRKHGS